MGFSIGLDRVMLAGPRLDEAEEGGVYILAIGGESRRRAFAVAHRLRGAGIRADLDHQERSPKAQMREADRAGFPLCVVIGEEETAGGYYTLRDMRSATQERVLETDLLGEIKRRMAAGINGPGPGGS